MALSLREAVFICDGTELMFRRKGWDSAGVDLRYGYTGDSYSYPLTKEDILADDYYIVRPNGTVATVPDSPGSANGESR